MLSFQPVSGHGGLALGGPFGADGGSSMCNLMPDGWMRNLCLQTANKLSPTTAPPPAPIAPMPPAISPSAPTSHAGPTMQPSQTMPPAVYTPPPVAPTPIYKKGWFWGVMAAGVATVGTIGYFALRGR